MDSNSKLITALLAGIAAGAAIGILMAPEKGAEIRKTIADSAKKLADNIVDAAEHGIDSITGAKKEIEQKVSRAANQAENAANRNTRQTV